MAKAKAVYRISAKEDPANQGVIRRFTGRLRGLGGGLGAVRGRIGALIGAGVGIAAGGALGNFARRMSETGAEVELLARRFSISSDAFQRFRIAAAANLVPFQEFTNLFQRFVRRTEEAEEGNADLVKRFEQFGISVDDIRRKDPEQLFRQLADGFAESSDKALALQTLIKILDVEGGRLFNTLELGSGGLDRLGRRAERLGLILDSETNQQMELLNENFTLLGLAAEAEGNRIVSRFANPLNDALDAILEKFEQLQTPGVERPFEPESLGLTATNETIDALNDQRDKIIAERDRVIEFLRLSRDSLAQIDEAQRAGRDINQRALQLESEATESLTVELADITKRLRSVENQLSNAQRIAERARETIIRNAQIEAGTFGGRSLEELNLTGRQTVSTDGESELAKIAESNAKAARTLDDFSGDAARELGRIADKLSLQQPRAQ